VVYVPTPQKVVDKMLEMAEVKKGDVVYDLGCGDGRIVVTAAKKYGVKAIGFDINPERVKESLENVRTNKVEKLVTIKEADIFTLDLSEATVVTLYLLPELNVRLMPQLAKLKPGARIVSHDFDMRGAKPVQVHRMNASSSSSSDDESDYCYASEHTIYKWVVPWEKDSGDKR
jgi:tRNA G37 N-methylase Trm5